MADSEKDEETTRGMNLRASNRNSIGRYASPSRIYNPNTTVAITAIETDSISSTSNSVNSDTSASEYENFFPELETMENEDEIYKINFVFKPVRYIQKSIADNLIKVASYLKK